VIEQRFSTCSLRTIGEQEAQLMLTNQRDAFGGQSRSPNYTNWLPLPFTF